MVDESCIFANSQWRDSIVHTIRRQRFRVILDLGPASKGHALILPKSHFKDVCELDATIAAKVLPLGARIGTAMKNRWAAQVLTWFRTTVKRLDKQYSISTYT